MVVGQTGESGTAVPLPVAVEHKHARVLVPTLPRPSVVLIVKGIVPSPNLVIPMDAQVRVIYNCKSMINKNCFKRKTCDPLRFN